MFAILGDKTRKKFVRYGCKPPANFRIESDLTYDQIKTIESNIAKNKDKLVKLFNEHGQSKFWQLARRLCDAAPSQPPIAGLIDDAGLAHMSEEGRNKVAIEHLKPLYQKLQKPQSAGKIVDPAEEFTVDEIVNAWIKHKSNKAMGPDLFDHKSVTSKLERRRFCTEIAAMMNGRTIPDYIKIAKVLLLSKKAGIVCKPEDSRCINLLNHTFKVMEIAVRLVQGWKKANSLQQEITRLDLKKGYPSVEQTKPV